MPKNTTAGTYISRGQWIAFGSFLVTTAAGLWFFTWPTIWILISLLLLIILAFVVLKFELVRASRHFRHHPRYDIQADDPDLPVYTVFVPMFDEFDAVPSILAGFEELEYDKRKLQVLILLETRATDPNTWAAFDQLQIPGYVELIELPPRKIRNKPTALNVGLSHARGEFAVIYDAEDRPEPKQLLKAVGTFRNVSETIGCLQARLRFSNETDSAVSRGLQLEYYIHFNQLLPGLAYHNMVPPLGGTSNHFRVSALHAIASPNRLTDEIKAVGAIGAWDSWNATEDAELAGRFYEMGYEISMLDSVTNEVATTGFKTVILQRSRWQKGYIQTWLTYLRNIRHHIRAMGFKRWLFFIAFLSGTTQTIIHSTLTWVLTAVYFVWRPTIIETMFPWPLLYLGAFLLVVGNFAIWVQHIVAAVVHCKPSSAFYTLGLLLWQQLATLSHLIAVAELAIPAKRYDWRKTPHQGNFASLDTAGTSQMSSEMEAPTDQLPRVVAPPAGRHRRATSV